MGADLSRVRFDARRDHAGVVLQQGRLLLDADWNELVAIVERRIRAEAADLDSPGPAAGIAGVAVVPRTTPDAFKVTLAGGALSIGRGRMYVDGLLAENHGVGPDEFEPLLREPRGTLDTPYDKQPYFPDPPKLPESGSHLAYLDVWQREVTHIEDPGVVDVAIGVDTTARMQTVWQLRLHDLGDASVSCSTLDADIPGWAALTAPSGARLSVDTIPVADSDDPCVLPPSGGYRGLENQTYRVEVHTGGTLGTATFKWSRDNGSVVSPVVEVTGAGTAVRVASIGKDAVLRFHDGDWVEITDDRRDLAGIAGELRKVTVNEQDSQLEFTTALPTDLRPNVADAAALHLRARRWDQRGQIKSAAGTDLDNLDSATATGAITVPAAAGTGVVLEAGIVVRFGSAGDDFRSGDHWIFAARTSDTSVEELTAAPPLGIQHHYARLGVLTFPDGETDCRILWPAECECDEGCGDCTVCVTPESHAAGAMTIQGAVDEVVARGGGTVCLQTGVYRLGGAVVIDQASSVTVRGQGLRTLLVSAEGAFRVTGSAYVTLEDFSVLAPGLPSAILLQTTAAVTVQRLTMVTVGNADQGGTAVTLGGVALLTSIQDNVFLVGTAVTGGFDDTPLLTAELTVRDNLMVCRERGVDLQGPVAHLLGNRAADNTVVRCSSVGIRLAGAISPGHGCEVRENTVVVAGVGIAVGSSGFTVADNDVTGTPASIEIGSAGIEVVPSVFASAVPGPTRITANRVRDVGGDGVRVLAAVSSLEISHNLVERAMHGIVMAERGGAFSVAAVDNTVLDVGSRQSDDKNGAFGIRLVGSTRAVVESNCVNGVGAAREVSGAAAGILVLGCPDSRVAGNSVDRIGMLEDPGEDVGIAVLGLIARIQASGNQSRRQPSDIDIPTSFRGLLIGSQADGREPAADLVAGYVVGNAAVPIVVGPLSVHTLELREAASVIVDTNIVSGGGGAPTAVVGVGRSDAILTGNQVRSRGEAPAMLVAADSIAVNANRWSGGGRESCALIASPDRITVLGNITSAGTSVNGVPLGAPWQRLNIDGIV